MSFESKRLIRLARDLADETDGVLSRKPLTAESLHDVRVILKRIRVLVRIFAHGPDGARFQKALGGLRGIARRLSAPRDEHVLRDLLARYVEKTGGSGRVRRGGRARIPARDLASAGRRILKTCELIRRGAERSAAGSAVKGESRRLRRNLRKRYSEARDTLAERSFHDWRKSVKNFYYFLDFGLADARSRGEYKAALRDLGKKLGHLHDLHNLASFMASGAAGTGLGGKVALKIQAVVRRDAEKQVALCLRLGERIRRKWL